MKYLLLSSGLLLAVLATACGVPVNQANPFLTLAETVGIDTSGDEEEDGGGGGGQEGIESTFRRTMTVTFANNHPEADLEVSFVAWVSASNIRSAEQQDALFNGGYVQLTRDTDIGTVFHLPPGTFVYNGPGTAGATPVSLGPAEAGTATTRGFDVITPDVILAYSQPPVSCDSVAFEYWRDGDVISDDFFENEPVGPFQGATGEGGYKTLAQVNVYQCDPLKPGLFLQIGGGARDPNEYLEGEDIRLDFNETPDADGNFCIVTIGG
jgi:hypothetical protein